MDWIVSSNILKGTVNSKNRLSFRRNHHKTNCRYPSQWQQITIDPQVKTADGQMFDVMFIGTDKACSMININISVNITLLFLGANFKNCKFKQWSRRTEVINAANNGWRAPSSEIWWTNPRSEDQQRKWKESKDTVSDHLQWCHVHTPPKMPCCHHLQQLCCSAGPVLWVGSCVFQMCISFKIQL